MKRQILLLAITAAAISSCTTAYRTGQTPDDVYYSPAKPQDEYVQVKEEDDKYRYDDDYYDDRYLRMKVQNRYRWNDFNDWYSYDRYGYRYNYYYGNYWNPYTSWNYYYNPYHPNTVVIINPKIPASQTNYSRPRNFNLSSYTGTSGNNTNNTVSKTFKPNIVTSKPVYNNRNNNNTGFSNTIKQIFSGGNNNSNSYGSGSSSGSSGSSSRTYTPSSSGSSSGSSGSSTGSSGSSSGSSGSSSGSSGGGATRPSRGGN